MTKAIMIACVLLFSLRGTALAQDGAAMAQDNAATPPGFAECEARHGAGCDVRYSAQDRIVETPALMEEATGINSRENASIRYEEDWDHYRIAGHPVQDYWTVPRDGFGDCEDYALAKKAALEQAGFPSGALRLALAFAGDEQHVVLLLVTDRHEYILDSPIGTDDRGHADEPLRTRDAAPDYVFYTVQNADGTWSLQKGVVVSLRFANDGQAQLTAQ